MCLLEDVLCVLSIDRTKSGNDAFVEVLGNSRFCVTSPLLQSALSTLVETGKVLEYTEGGRRDGLRARERILCTPPLYRRYRLTRIGNGLRRQLMSRKRIGELK